jgi:uncharacterized damage-inducible protein DinB
MRLSSRRAEPIPKMATGHCRKYTLIGGIPMTSYLEEILAHQEWADAEHWRAFESHAGALKDTTLRERLLHIHLAQHAFLWIADPRAIQFVAKKHDDFPADAELKRYAQEANAGLRELIRSLSPESLEENIEIPWLKPALMVSRRHALMQAAMHSHYHRGQNATRFRELGGIPPTTDFILWVKEGKPAAKWS